MYRLTSIKARAALFGAVALIVIFVVSLATFNYLGAVDETERALNSRYESYLLADELRQSSEDLTRLARTYVVTADSSFEDQYNQVVAIRNGDQPRPAAYNRIYWSFIAAGEPAPRPETEAVPLRDLMKRAGFTDAEFALLDAATARSDGLIALEVEAMSAVKGLFKDASGQYTVKGAPDLERARELLHSPQYHRYVADIMKPIDEFYVLLDQRTSGAIEVAASRQELGRWMLFASFAILGLLILAFGVYLARAVIAPMGRLTGIMGRIADGHLDTDVAFKDRRDELGQMASAVEVFRANGERVRDLTAEEGARNRLTAERAQMMERFQSAFEVVVEATVEGDFSKRIDERFDDPDIDRISGNFNGMLETVSAALDEASVVLAALADTDLTQRMEGSYRGVFAKLRDNTNSVADNLTRVVGQLRDTSLALKSATGEILSGANDLAERTTRQAATIEETSAAMEQLSSTVADNAQKAEEAAVRTQSAAQLADEGGQVMNEATDAMERITSSSAKISNIIGMIDDIAFQTNLLALNASVEAARAGEAGKGFAVVAVEVRRLAQSAAQASAEVKQLIEQSAQEVSGGSKLVANAASKLEAILEAVQENSQLMRSISQASREQSSAIGEVNLAVRQMDEMTQHNAALVEETNAAIEQTEAQANDLDRIVEVFRVGTAATQVQATAAGEAEAKTRGIRALQEKVKSAARSYLSNGNTAIKEEWSEF